VTFNTGSLLQSIGGSTGERRTKIAVSLSYPGIIRGCKHRTFTGTGEANNGAQLVIFKHMVDCQLLTYFGLALDCIARIGVIFKAKVLGCK